MERGKTALQFTKQSGRARHTTAVLGNDVSQETADTPDTPLASIVRRAQSPATRSLRDNKTDWQAARSSELLKIRTFRCSGRLLTYEYS